MADPGADVTIRYSFLPTEGSIRESAERVEKQLNRVVGRPLTVAKGKKLTSEFDKTVDMVVNFLRATQQKTSLQTKIMAGLKLVGGGSEKAASGGGETSGGMMGAVGGGGGGMMGALASIAVILVAISVAMFILSAFFEAVGPIIKMFMKVLAAVFLLLLAPILRRIMPVISQLIKAIIGGAKAFAGGEEAVFAAIGGLITGELFKPIKDILFDVAKTIVQGLTLIFFELYKVLVGVVFDAVIQLLEGFKLLGIVILDFLKIDSRPFATSISLLQNALATTRNTIIDTLNKMELVAIFAEGTFFDAMKTLTDTGWENVYTIVKNWMDTITNYASVVFGGGGGGGKYKFSSGGAYAGGGTRTYGTPEYETSRGGMVLDWSGGGTGQSSKNSKLWSNYFNGTASDFVWRAGKGIQKFSSDDTIIGSKSGMNGGQTINNYLTVSAGVDKNEFRKILSDFNREQARELRMRSSYVAGVYS